MESLKDVVGDWEHVPVKEYIGDLGQDFGRGHVTIIRIFIINVYIQILNL